MRTIVGLSRPDELVGLALYRSRSSGKIDLKTDEAAANNIRVTGKLADFVNRYVRK